MNSKTLVSVGALLITIVMFQNCGRAPGESTSSSLDKLIPQPIAKTVVEVNSEGVSIHQDGQVSRTGTGDEIVNDPAIKAKIQALFSRIELCAYINGPLPPTP